MPAIHPYCCPASHRLSMMPIEIGRLGYTTFEKGTWVGLWEVLPKEECGLIQSGTFKGGQTYSSEGVHNTSVNAELFAGFPLRGGGGFGLNCSKRQGAILAIPEDADSEDAQQKDYILDAICRGFCDWKERLREEKFSLEIDQLLVVTGWDKASSWANAVFTDGSNDFHVDIGFGQPELAEGKLFVKVEWSSPGSRSVEKNWGPASGLISEGKQKDQCIFVRGFKMLDRATWFTRKLSHTKKQRLKATASLPSYSIPRRRKDEDEDPNPGPSSSGSSECYANSSGTVSTSEQSSTSVTSAPSQGSSSSGGSQTRQVQISGVLDYAPDDTFGFSETLEEYSPPPPEEMLRSHDYLTLMLDYILENDPGSIDLAIVHHDDLERFMPISSLEQFKYRLGEVYPEILLVDRHGLKVGVLGPGTARMAQNREYSNVVHIQNKNTSNSSNSFSTAIDSRPSAKDLSARTTFVPPIISPPVFGQRGAEASYLKRRAIDSSFTYPSDFQDSLDEEIDFDPRHTWRRPGRFDSRSPCPALNAAANHGYIPRDGRKMTMWAIIKGIRECYNVSWVLATIFTVVSFIILRTNGVGEGWVNPKIDLEGLATHNVLEHDASLTRLDMDEFMKSEERSGSRSPLSRSSFLGSDTHPFSFLSLLIITLSKIKGLLRKIFTLAIGITLRFIPFISVPQATTTLMETSDELFGSPGSRVPRDSHTHAPIRPSSEMLKSLFADSASGTHLTLKDFARARIRRLEECRGRGIKIPFHLEEFANSESCLALALFSEKDGELKVKIETLKVWLEEERLPPGWKPRREIGFLQNLSNTAQLKKMMEGRRRYRERDRQARTVVFN